MQREYEMTEQHPCPACQGIHRFGATDGVAAWDERLGTVFRVACPTTGEKVEVVVPPVDVEVARDPVVIGAMTDKCCPVCNKANFRIAREVGAGPVVTQYLECSNEGCGYELLRRWSRIGNIEVK